MGRGLGAVDVTRSSDFMCEEGSTIFFYGRRTITGKYEEPGREREYLMIPFVTINNICIVLRKTTRPIHMLEHKTIYGTLLEANPLTDRYS